MISIPEAQGDGRLRKAVVAVSNGEQIKWPNGCWSLPPAELEDSVLTRLMLDDGPDLFRGEQATVTHHQQSVGSNWTVKSRSGRTLHRRPGHVPASKGATTGVSDKVRIYCPS